MRRRWTLRPAVPALLLLAALWLAIPAEPSGARVPPERVVVTLGTRPVRHRELGAALRSLLRQSAPPAEIRVHASAADRHFWDGNGSNGTGEAGQEFKWRAGAGVPRQLKMRSRGVRLIFVGTDGPAAKYLDAIREMCRDGARPQLLAVVDDDHYYTPDLLANLLRWRRVLLARHPAGVAVAHRGWRTNADFSWGCPYSRCVVQGAELAAPYRVGVVTANEGYLVDPAWFCSNGTDPLAGRKGLLSLLRPDPSIPALAGLVDDVWMSGHLAALDVPRYVVPLPSGKSADVTSSRVLDEQLRERGTTRKLANTQVLGYFARVWRAEAGWYYDWTDPERGKERVGWAEALRRSAKARLRQWWAGAEMLLLS
ncbi:hypothetical protein DFJ74DRAFT_722086 [Hyaloraphidium curvatum]|nr:hypothetical protein DFJ74DRAFT_722086 [Hyaloraphidium curvatum]